LFHVDIVSAEHKVWLVTAPPENSLVIKNNANLNESGQKAKGIIRFLRYNYDNIELISKDIHNISQKKRQRCLEGKTPAVYFSES
jgi:hypothetical protein